MLYNYAGVSPYFFCCRRSRRQGGRLRGTYPNILTLNPLGQLSRDRKPLSEEGEGGRVLGGQERLRRGEGNSPFLTLRVRLHSPVSTNELVVVSMPGGVSFLLEGTGSKGSAGAQGIAGVPTASEEDNALLAFLDEHKLRFKVGYVRGSGVQNPWAPWWSPRATRRRRCPRFVFVSRFVISLPRNSIPVTRPP